MTRLPADDPRHGTYNGYRNLLCRCGDCRRAHAQYVALARCRRRARLTAEDPRHGQSNTYTNHGCRCATCNAAHTDAKRATR